METQTERAAPKGFGKVRTVLEMVKIEHTVFALPFAYMGAFLAAGGFPGWARLLWVTVAMFGARSLAMSLNRLIDAGIDALNPRTAGRALPAGLLQKAEVALFAAVSLGLLLLAAWNLQPITRLLWPIPVVAFVIYPYTKRFTWLSHGMLGLSIGLAPIGAWLAISGKVTPAAFFLGLAVLFWIGGFDIIYACQDHAVDVAQGLNSIPVRFGLDRALMLARVWHLLAITCLIVVGFLLDLGLVYFFGVLTSAILLAFENAIIRPDDLSMLDTAFFTMNGIISIVMFAFTLVDLLWLRIF